MTKTIAKNIPPRARQAVEANLEGHAAPSPARQDRAGAATATTVDPGPPPTLPRFPGAMPVGSTQDRIHMAAMHRDREAVLAQVTLNRGPALANYKAEVLAWLEAMEAYEERKAG